MRLIVWCDAGDGEGRNQFAGATGTLLVLLFNHDSNKHTNMSQDMADKGKEGKKQGSGKQRQSPATSGWIDNVSIKYIL